MGRILDPQDRAFNRIFRRQLEDLEHLKKRLEKCRTALRVITWMQKQLWLNAGTLIPDFFQTLEAQQASFGDEGRSTLLFLEEEYRESDFLNKATDTTAELVGYLEEEIENLLDEDNLDEIDLPDLKKPFNQIKMPR